MDAIDLFTNHRKMLICDLIQFLANAPEGSDMSVLEPLADKIEHMCIHIGSPSSVKPMLESICNRKVKKWGNDYDNKGKQLTGYPQWVIDRHYQDTRKGTHNILIGHFRWNHTVYQVNRDDANYINAYFLERSFPITQGPKRSMLDKFKMSVEDYKNFRN